MQPGVTPSCSRQIHFLHIPKSEAQLLFQQLYIQATGKTSQFVRNKLLSLFRSCPWSCLPKNRCCTPGRNHDLILLLLSRTSYNTVSLFYLYTVQNCFVFRKQGDILEGDGGGGAKTCKKKQNPTQEHFTCKLKVSTQRVQSKLFLCEHPSSLNRECASGVYSLKQFTSLRFSAF